MACRLNGLLRLLAALVICQTLAIAVAGAAGSAGAGVRIDIAAGQGFPVSPHRIASGWDGSYAMEARLHLPISRGTDFLVVAGRSLFALREGGNYGGLNITRLTDIESVQGGALEVRSLGGAVLVTPWNGPHLTFHVLLSIAVDQILQRRVTFKTSSYDQTVTPPAPGSHLGVVFGGGVVFLPQRSFSPFLEVVDHIVNAVPAGVDEGALQFPTVKVGVTTRLR